MSAKAKKAGAGFFSGVLALTVANLFVKVVGLLLKIPLRGILTDSGMAYYNNAYDIYAFLYTISTIGLPTAVSMMVSENRAKGRRKEAQRVFKTAVFLFIIVGLIGTCIMFFGAPIFEKAYKIDNSAYCIMAVAPTLFFICVAGALKGFFQGYQYMTPSAISNVIEAMGKMAIGILLATYAAKQGEPPHIIAAYAAMGLTIGVAAGLVFLIVRKLLFKPREFDSEYADIEDLDDVVSGRRQIIKRLIAIAIPITLSTSVMTFSNVIDGIILSRGLQVNFTQEATKAFIGIYKTCVTPISNIILAFTNPLSSVIVPYVSAAISAGKAEKAKRAMDSTLRMAVIVILPCIFGISALSKQIIAFLFRDSSVAVTAGPLLSVHALSVFFMCMISTSSAFLQAHKLEKKPLKAMLVGAVVKIVSTSVLVVIPAINVMGSPISAILSGLAIASVNFYSVKKYIGYKPNFISILTKPIIAALVCALTAIGSYKLYGMLIPSPDVILIMAIMTAAIAYIITALLIKAVGREEIEMLPKGRRIAALLTKIKLLPPKQSV